MLFREELAKEAIKYNIDNNKPLSECIFRRESSMFQAYFSYLKENKEHYELNEFDHCLLSTDIGEQAEFEGNKVWLDLPFVDEKKIEKDKDDPCWAGYVQMGTKIKDGKEVPNCVPLKDVNEADEDIELNQPKRSSESGTKKYYVYVKNDKGNVVKVRFGDEKGGLTAKINDKEAVKSFVARHKCSEKTDKTSPGYWACRLPYYAKNLGLSGGGKYYW